MNKDYYQAIYLNTSPSPLDVSLITTNEIIHKENHETLVELWEDQTVQLEKNTPFNIYTSNENGSNDYVHVKAKVYDEYGLLLTRFQCEYKTHHFKKIRAFPLLNPITKLNHENKYEFYFFLLDKPGILSVNLSTTDQFIGQIKELEIYTGQF